VFHTLKGFFGSQYQKKTHFFPLQFTLLFIFVSMDMTMKTAQCLRNLVLPVFFVVSSCTINIHFGHETSPEVAHDAHCHAVIIENKKRVPSIPLIMSLSLETRYRAV